MKNLELVGVSVIFYIGWFGCVFLAKTPFSAWSLIFPTLLISFLQVRKNLNWKNTLFALVIASFGIIFDFLLIHLEMVQVSETLTLLIPVWLMAIWILFSFSMIKIGPAINPPIWLSALLGMIMGPLSYKSGEIFEVLKLSSSTTIFIYGIFWAIAFPTLLNFSKRFV